MPRLGRNHQGVTNTGASVQLAGPNDKRFALVVSPPGAGRVTLGFGAPAVLDAGITLFASTAPFILLYAHIGDALREEITSITSGAGVIGVLDVFWL